jgi:hypothetical protein
MWKLAFCTHNSSERMEEASRAVSVMGSHKNHYIYSSLRELYMAIKILKTI